MEQELRSWKQLGRFYSWSEFDSNVPFILTTDWSALNIAEVLSQKYHKYEKQPLNIGWTVGTGQEYAEVGANPEVPAPFLIYMNVSSLKYIVNL